MHKEVTEVTENTSNEHWQFVTVSKTAKARRAIKGRDYEAIKGYYRIRLASSEATRLQDGKVSRVELLHEMGVY